MNPTDRPSGRTPAAEDPGDFDPGDILLSAQDARLLDELNNLLDIADPVPDDLATRTRFAIDLEYLDFEVAQWRRENELAGVRGSTASNTITFTVGDLTVMVSLAPATNGNRFDGWLVPGGPHTIDVRVDDHDTITTTADDGGRFALVDVPRGLTQIVVHLAGNAGQKLRTVVTPTIVL
jgi:hypothetical protein